MKPSNHDVIEFEAQFAANTYHPLPVALVKGEGAYLWDIEGNRYLDMMSAYSATSLGHAHPKLIAALIEQAKQLTLVSRAYHTPQMGVFLQRACELTGMEKACPMNTGAEAVETAIKVARKWADVSRPGRGTKQHTRPDSSNRT